MKTIHVSASRDYDVLIGEGLLSRLGQLVTSVCKPCKAVIVSDSNVWPLYGDSAADCLISAGFEVLSYVFPAGEESKNPETYLSLLNYLAENQLTRSDLLIALGGGVVGDLAGFAAATYLRGVACVQIPTSLLAMVDSSVGGKTAIDLPAGKNLVGSFFQPRLVVCDPDVLRTLPADIFRDGCAEVIKYGVLYDPALFGHLASNGLAFDRETVIARCVELKRDVVSQDEFDTGARQKLNLGHTFGHAIEALSQFTVTHGKAVAIGMAVMTRSAAAAGYCTTHTAEQITEVLRSFALPYSTNLSAAAICGAALSDKKRFGDTVNLIIPRVIGCCEIVKTPVTQLKSFIEAGL